MGMFTSQKFDSLDDLLIEQMQDLYDAEQRLCDALPKMVDAASNSRLKDCFQQHLQETRNQVQRLEQAFQVLGCEAERQTCDAMKGLISEGDDVIGAKGDAHVIDAALIAAAQRIEHYEMAGYGTCRSLAQHLGKTQVAQLMQQTLDEEGNADKLLTEIAESVVNVQAMHA